MITVTEKNESVFAASHENRLLLSQGMEVDVSVGDEVYRAKVGGPEEFGVREPSENTVYLALLDFAMLQENVYGRIELLEAERHDVLLVPSAAVVSSGDGKYVYLIENNIKTVRYVDTGLETSTFIEIISGLSEGDEILSGGGM